MVVDLLAMDAIAVATGARMHADIRTLRRLEAIKHLVVQVDERL